MVCACAEAAASRARRQTKRQRARIPAESTPDGRLDISGTWTGLGKPARRITFRISVGEGKKVPREETDASAAPNGITPRMGSHLRREQNGRQEQNGGHAFASLVRSGAETGATPSLLFSARASLPHVEESSIPR